MHFFKMFLLKFKLTLFPVYFIILLISVKPCSHLTQIKFQQGYLMVAKNISQLCEEFLHQLTYFFPLF